MNLELVCTGKEPHLFTAEPGTLAAIPVGNDAEEPASFRLTFHLPVIDVHGIWHPGLERPLMELPWVIRADSNSVYDVPFFSCFNAAQKNVCSVYADFWKEDFRFSSRVNQQNSCFDVVLEFTLPGKTASRIFIDSRPLPWQKTLADFRDLLYAGRRPQYPAAAWEPVFCSWYAVHGAISQAWVEANAPLAAEMGFRTFILDDGWSYDENKRVTPETLGTWYNTIGNWTLSEKKFPDFQAHRERMRQWKLKYVFWVAPFIIGSDSDMRKAFPGCAPGEIREGYSTLDVFNKPAATEVLKRVIRAAKNYELDGLKVDFLDLIHPSPERPAGREAAAFTEKLCSELRAAVPDALIEFRQRYATPGTAFLATQFRAGDVPFDFLRNFQRLCQIRITMGDGVPIHADPAYWNAHDLPENVSRHLIASLAGVPMLSMELTDMPVRTRRIILRWLKFYKEHQPVLNFGHWTVAYENGSTGFASVEKDGERIVIIRSAGMLRKALKDFPAGRCHVLNLSGEEIPLPGASVTDCEGNPLPGDGIPPGAQGTLCF